MNLGRYALGPLLGRGGMARVYRARDTRLGRMVAVKLLAPGLADDPDARRLFLSEARVAAGLNHPAIVTVHDHDEAILGGETVAYLVMEYIDGPTLAELLREQGPLPLETALRLTEGVLRGLDHAHRRGVVHRDIKPANVMLAGDGSLKVTDFGIARVCGTDTNRLTHTGALIGTLSHMAPEIVTGGRAGPAGDVYAVGCTLYQLLTGEVPYHAENGHAVLYQHIHAAVPVASALRHGLPPAVDGFLATALAKRPDARFPDAGAMLGALAELSGRIRRAWETPRAPGTRTQDGTPDDAEQSRAGTGDTTGDHQPEDREPPPVKQESHERRRALAIAASCVIALGLTVSLTWFLRDDTPGTERPITRAAAAPDLPTDSPAMRAADARGHLLIGVKDDQIGLGHRDPVTGRYEGFDIEIARMIAAHLGYGPERMRFVPVATAHRETALAKGDIDYYVGSYSITDERKRLVSFAGPYFATGQGLLVRRDENAISGLDDSMRGHTVCSVKGSTPLSKVRRDFPGVALRALDSYASCVDALRRREVDGVTTDQAILQGFAAHDRNHLKIVGIASSFEKYGVGLAKEDASLRAAVNDALQAAYSSGRWKQAYDRTLGVSGVPAPSPPALERY